LKKDFLACTKIHYYESDLVMDTNTDNIKMPASIRSKYPDKDTKIHVRSKPATNYLYSERITLKHPLPNSEQDDSVPPIQSCRFSPVPIQSRPIQSRRFSPRLYGDDSVHMWKNK